MLILSRRIDEKLIIGENVTVTILAVKGNQVRIGIDAPRDVRVDREEIHQRILEEEEERRHKSVTRVTNAAGMAPSPSGGNFVRTLSLSSKR